MAFEYPCFLPCASRAVLNVLIWYLKTVDDKSNHEFSIKYFTPYSLMENFNIKGKNYSYFYAIIVHCLVIIWSFQIFITTPSII